MNHVLQQSHAITDYVTKISLFRSKTFRHHWSKNKIDQNLELFSNEME